MSVSGHIESYSNHLDMQGFVGLASKVSLSFMESKPPIANIYRNSASLKGKKMVTHF
jgi:hypothetical protein